MLAIYFLTLPWFAPRRSTRSNLALRRCGISLVELLVTLSIMGLLIAILFPAVFGARAAARRATCENNLRQIGLGLQSYHVDFDAFPPGVVEWRAASSVPSRESETRIARQLAWSAFLLPYLDEQPLFEQLDLTTPFDSLVNADGAASILSVYVCPESVRGAQLIEGRGPIDYGGMYGERISSANNPPKGVMIHNQGLSIRQIVDGVSKTIIVAEDSRFLDGQWINGRNIFDQAYGINRAPLWENDIRSDHVGGAFAGMADGSVKFLAETIDLDLLAALCTRSGHEVVSPPPKH